jgi:hypothetical protein
MHHVAVVSTHPLNENIFRGDCSCRKLDTASSDKETMRGAIASHFMELPEKDTVDYVEAE